MKNFENIAVAPEHCVKFFGRSVVVAPHADDESLGCGGIISLLRKYGQEVFIVLLSDGTLSHPNSKMFPSEKLQQLRENELKKAASFLNVSEENIIFCRYKDRSVPGEQSLNFEDGILKISNILQNIKPKSIFVPWRRDPHPDHRAAFQLIRAASTDETDLYEYPVWLQEIGEDSDNPLQSEIRPFRIDISTVLEQKLKAISCHQSQISDLIPDDPEGFRLSQSMLDQFKIPYETFFISI